jgi:hypothetical protein
MNMNINNGHVTTTAVLHIFLLELNLSVVGGGADSFLNVLMYLVTSVDPIYFHIYVIKLRAIKLKLR